MLPDTVTALLPREFRPAAPAACTPLTGGSDRSFYRCTHNGRSFIILHDTALEDEFDRFIRVQQRLWKAGQGVPELFFYDLPGHLAVLEDLGDTSLEQLNAGGSLKEKEERYLRVIDFLVAFQAGMAHPAGDPVIGDRVFGTTMLRWETWYFRTHFLGVLKRIPAACTQTLLPEFARLAGMLNRAPQVLLHRDFQAQNIYITDGRVRIIDFQAVQPGPAGYDAVSLIRDPYACLPAGLCRELLQRYRDRSVVETGILISDDVIFAATLQRLLQALGAYGYLSCVKGKRQYLDYIPAALSQLRDVFSGREDDFPVLWSIISAL